MFMLITAPADGSASTSSVTVTKCSSHLAKMLDDDDEEEDIADVTTPHVQASKQLSSFQSLVEQTTMKFDSCPLAWWRTYASQFPDLAVVARSYLSVQATSCASERLFSKAGFIVSNRRSKLSREHVAMLTFMATNAS